MGKRKLLAPAMGARGWGSAGPLRCDSATSRSTGDRRGAQDRAVEVALGASKARGGRGVSKRMLFAGFSMLCLALLCRSCGCDVVDTGGDKIFKSLIKMIPG